MNKTDYVKSALRFENADKVPYSINLTGDGYQAYGEQLIADYGSEKIKADYAEGRLTLMEATALAIGNYIVFLAPPWWTWHNLPAEFSEPDTPSILPDTIGVGSYEAFFAKARYLKENYDVYVLCTIWGSHWEKAYFCRGIENFLCDMLIDPDWSHDLLNMIIRKNIVMLENILCCKDLDGILLGSDWGTQKDLIMSPQTFREMLKDGEIQEYELVKKYGKDVFVHSCGNILNIMDDLVEMGVQCLNPVQPECMDLNLLKTKYGSRMAYFGGISTQRTLPYGTPEDVAAETREIVRLMSKNGGYVTSPSQEIQTDVPYENLRALIDTAKEFG